MAKATQSRRRFLLETSQAVSEGGALRQVIAEAHDGYVVLRLRGLKVQFSVPWNHGVSPGRGEGSGAPAAGAQSGDRDLMGNGRRGNSRGKNSPWRGDHTVEAQRRKMAAPASTAWDRFLWELDISEDQALKIAVGKIEGPRSALRLWAKEFRGRYYIPEELLRALELRMDEVAVASESRQMIYLRSARGRAVVAPGAE